MGIRFGPNFNGTQAAFLTGSVKYTDSRPWVLEADGSLSLFDKQVASGFLKYQSDGAIDFGFDVNWDFYSVLDITGGVRGWYQPSGQTPKPEFVLDNPVDRQRYNNFLACGRKFGFQIFSCIRQNVPELAKIPRRTVQVPYPAKFDVFGHAKVCAITIVCVGGEAAVSSVGVAGCAEATVFGYPEPYWFGVRWVPVKIRAGGRL